MTAAPRVVTVFRFRGGCESVCWSNSPSKWVSATWVAFFGISHGIEVITNRRCEWLMLALMLTTGAVAVSRRLPQNSDQEIRTIT
jgi:hypothetical protein